MSGLELLISRLADGATIDEAWEEAGFVSRKAAERALRELATGAGRMQGRGRPEVPGRPESPRGSSGGRGAEAPRNGAGVDDLVIYTDGASRGNPGPSAIAAVARLTSGEILTSISRRIGRATNNVAEYTALIEGLRLAAELGAKRVTCRLDSELIVRQLQGRYRIKNERLGELSRDVRAMMGRFEHCEFEHIGRDENREADRLAGEALDGTGEEA